MAELRTLSFPSSDGIHTIQGQEWLPVGQPKAVVQIVHGVAEHIGRYDRTARFLCDHGYLVCGADHLGHGRTAQQDGSLGYFAPRDGWKLVTDDVRRLRLLQGEKYPGIPYFMLGHSMGSFLTRTYLCRFPGEISGAVLSGTGQEPAIATALGGLIARCIRRSKGDHYISPLIHSLSLGSYNRKFKPNRTSSDWISRDEAAVDAYLSDPLCSFQPSVGMFIDMLDGLRYIASPKSLKRMDPDTPVYFFSGEQDPVGGMGKQVKKVYGWFYAHGVKDLSLKLYPGGRHEMFNELNRQQVLDDLLQWLDRHQSRAKCSFSLK